MVLASVEWGTVPDWLAAIGTVGALLAGAAILNKQRTSLEQQAEMFQWQAEERERGQALRVTGWVERVDEDKIVGHVANGSDEPIYSCVLYVKDADQWESDPQPEVVPLPQGWTVEDRVVQDIELVFLVVPPQAREEFPYTLQPHQRTAIDEMPFPGAQAEVGFVDSRGQAWLRDSSGTLIKTDAPRIC